MPTIEFPNTENFSYDEQLQIIHAWRQLSDLQYYADVEGKYDDVNQILQIIADKGTHPLAKFAGHWLGENFAAQGNYEKALATQQMVLDRFSEQYLDGRSWGAIALESMAEYAFAIDSIDLAIERYFNLLSIFPEDPNRISILLRIAEFQEISGQADSAMQTYEKALETSTEDNPYIRSRLASIRSGAPWARKNLEDLTLELTRCLQNKDAGQLSSLMPEEVFYVSGGAGEIAGLETPMIAEMLINDLAMSDHIEVDESIWHHSGHRKAYLRTSGWTGEHFQETIIFQFRKELEGWIFAGIVGGLVADGYLYKKIIHTKPTSADQQSEDRDDALISSISAPVLLSSTLTLKLKAPWENGLRFFAGGVDESIFGSIVGLVTASLSAWIQSFGPCGFGVKGFYYGQWGHLGSDYYAVDFLSYKKGVPWMSITKGQKVLSVAEGWVSKVVSRYEDGSTSYANEVYLQHWNRKEGEGGRSWLAAVFAELFLGQKGAVDKVKQDTRFVSTYLHMEGGIRNPHKSKVKYGQHLLQGSVLGHMDDTGISALDHLHFSLYEKVTGNPVMLDLIDGQTLYPDEAGKCMYSTNVAR